MPTPPKSALYNNYHIIIIVNSYSLLLIVKSKGAYRENKKKNRALFLYKKSQDLQLIQNCINNSEE